MRGGKRKGAGRPLKSGTVRKSVKWRLPIHLLTAAYRRAEVEGITVSAWVEDAIRAKLSSKS